MNVLASWPAVRLLPLQRAPATGLLLHEIFASIQGESTYAGRPCTFIRTTACNLRCSYCDTRHAFTEGEPWQLPAVLARVEALGLPLVEITGGEPLLQPLVLPLMVQLCERGYEVLLETSGSLDVGEVDPRVIKIMDLKAPSSREVGANRMANLDLLTPRDEVKFVLGDRTDYVWARELTKDWDLSARCTVLMGTVHGVLSNAELAAWIVADRLPVRMQVQMHKVIWDAERRGV